MDHSLPLNDVARSEFANGVALLTNTVPNAFWMLYHIYSDPVVLEDCRKELSGVVVVTGGNEAEPTNTIDNLKSQDTLSDVFLDLQRSSSSLQYSSIGPTGDRRLFTKQRVPFKERQYGHDAISCATSRSPSLGR